MNTLKILVVEDNFSAQEDIRDSTDTFNQKFDGIHKVETVFAKSLDEAMKTVDTTFDGALLDLNLGDQSDHNKNGNEVARKLEGASFRIPVIFVTAFPDEVADLPIIYRKYSRGERYENVYLNFIDLKTCGLTNVMGGRGEMERILTSIFVNNLMPQIDRWITYGKQNPKRSEKAMLRHAISHVMEYLDEEEDTYLPEEVYVSPVSGKTPATGSLANGALQSDSKWHIVLSPACDLAQGKTTDILLAEIQSLDDGLLTSKGVRRDEAEIKKALKNNLVSHLHFLPPIDGFDGGFINFRKVSAISHDTYARIFKDSNSKLRVAAPFVKDIVSRFSAYFSRQGQPLIETKELQKKFGVKRVE